MSIPTKTEHTPGPWKATEHGEIFSPEPTPSHVASVNQFPNHSESEANVRLIAAAPDLLAALIACRKDISTPISDHPWAIKQRKAHALADAAIAKAKERQAVALVARFVEAGRHHRQVFVGDKLVADVHGRQGCMDLRQRFLAGEWGQP